jgi:hypothetical protein
MVGRPMRTIARLALPAFIVTTLLLSGTASADVAWGPQRVVKDWSWSTGTSLVVTGSGASATISQLFSTDFVGGGFATDHGPYEGVFVTSSGDRGQTWSGPVRVSQPKRHADRGALASDGSSLYAVWVTRASYDHDSPSARRILYFRARLAAGWGPTIRLSKQKGRVDVPSVAAAAGRVYVVWTDANTGDVRLAVTADDGKSWKRSVLGKAKATDSGGEGHVGLPSVGAAGGNVGVAWISTGSGAIKARVSTNGGRKWHDPVSIVGASGAVNGGSPSIRGWGDRLALAWSTPQGVFSRIWSGSWAASRPVASFGQGATYRGGFDVEVVPSRGGKLGIVWSACRTSGCDPDSALTRADVLWSDSAGGDSWSAPSLVQGSVHDDQRMNDSPTATWLDEGTPIVVYTGRSSGWTSYGLFLRVGA